MLNECKKCNVVHSSLANQCISCGEALKKANKRRVSFGLPTLVATTFLSLSVVFMNFTIAFGG